MNTSVGRVFDTMNERDSCRIIESNLPKLVEEMLTLQPNESVEVYCDP